MLKIDQRLNSFSRVHKSVTSFNREGEGQASGYYQGITVLESRSLCS